jgi:aminoglycoside phosphotransferase (APT) family kinase protein
MNTPGPFSSWSAVIERDMQTSPAEVHEEVMRWRGYLDRVAPTCFLDDLTVKNVIVMDGEFQGIVDLDTLCYGDPLYWLSLAEVTVVLDVGASASFYGEELRRLWGMSNEANAVCDLYNVIQSWFFLAKGVENEALHDWSSLRLQRCHDLRTGTN